jgi:hypothetical protein
MLTAILLTPMMLATEPFQLQMPDRSYDHQSQVSTFNGELTNLDPDHDSPSPWLALDDSDSEMDREPGM